MKLHLALIAVVGLIAILSLGCGGANPAAKDDHGHGHEHGHDHGTEAAGHEHGGWWCAEHGVPEDICAQCSSKVAADFQKKGDWCKQHDRPDSQCFLCHPELEAKFAQQYEAREGKKPPKR